jgi:hypothetical protein
LENYACQGSCQDYAVNFHKSAYARHAVHWFDSKDARISIARLACQALPQTNQPRSNTLPDNDFHNMKNACAFFSSVFAEQTVCECYLAKLQWVTSIKWHFCSVLLHGIGPEVRKRRFLRSEFPAIQPFQFFFHDSTADVLRGLIDACRVQPRRHADAAKHQHE